MLITTYNSVPKYYTRESRDFQLLGHIVDSVTNYSKLCIDSMLNLPYSFNMNTQFLDLLAKTLGFETKHQYNDKNLLALCGAFKNIVKYKGTFKAINDCINLLKTTQGITTEHYIDITLSDNIDVYLKNNQSVPDDVICFNLSIYLPINLVDVVLLEDMFNYILPIGFTYTIYKNDIASSSDVTTSLKVTSSVSQSSIDTISSGKLSFSQDNNLQNINNTIVNFNNNE